MRIHPKTRSNEFSNEAVLVEQSLYLLSFFDDFCLCVVVDVRNSVVIMELNSIKADFLENLELLFREYGVAFEEAVVLDSYYHVNGSRYNVISSVPSDVESELATNLNSTQYVVMPYSRVMYPLWSEKNAMTSTSVLNSSGYSYGKVVEPGVPLTSFEAAEGDLGGSFASAIHIYRYTVEGRDAVERNLLFLSSAHVFDESYINTESYGNMQLFTNVFSQFNKANTTISVPAKRYEDPALTVTGSTRTIVLVLLCLIPVAVLAMGIVVWQRRKNR